MADHPSVTKETLPDFSAPMTSDKTFQLTEQKGKNIVLFFYPKDNTPGCTTESMNFRDLYAEFQNANTEIFGISRDSLRSHENFKAKLQMPFELISDSDEKLCSLFDVIREKKMYGKIVRGIQRSTFVIGADGKLLKEWRTVKVPGHVDEVLEYVISMGKD